jgi:aspartyl aminopeptidase
MIPCVPNKQTKKSVGAASPIMGEAVKRISSALLEELSPGALSSTSIMDMYEATIRKSFVVSSDQAHALHPNYAAKHEKNHQPQMNRGMVIKRNSNQRYATNGVTGMIIREIARRENLKPVQEFIVRQDCGCGSTIGPVISAATGIRAIDMGCPQLSMHSIRETMGVCDCTWWGNLGDVVCFWVCWSIIYSSLATTVHCSFLIVGVILTFCVVLASPP